MVNICLTHVDFVASSATGSTALELRWKALVTNVEKNAERYRNVEVDAENVSPKSSAETDGSLEVSQPLDDRAAWLR
uniref:Uncharacterized protein n=1 Tax=Noccaea caerulescens TaxID=107243 RepID=A0A1J3JLY1_NOCCA